MIDFGEQHAADPAEYDFFAVSLPEFEVFQDDLAYNNRQYCTYLRALGELGLGSRGKAEALLNEVLHNQPDYQGALIHMRLLSWEEFQ